MGQTVNPTPSTLIWISDNDLSESLHAATWLETTKTLRELGWNVELLSHNDVEGVRDVRGVSMRFFSKPDIFFIQQLLYHFKIFCWVIKNYIPEQVIMFHEISGFWALLFKMYTRLFSKMRLTFLMDTRTLPMEPEDTLTLRAKLRRAYLGFIDRHANQWFDGRMAITPAMAEVLEIPNNKLWAVWPSGVKPEIFSDCTQNRSYPNSNELIRLIYIGCMHVERNLMTMCKAVVKANQSLPQFKLVLVGEGNEFDELEMYANNHPGDILLHGPVPQNEIPKWLAESHVGILPFPDEEKFRVSSPIKLFEYMAAGMPILATKIRCHTDVIDGDAEYVFWADGSDETALLDALHEIVLKKDQLPKMGQHSVDNIQLWSWQASARKIDEGLRKHLNLAASDPYGK